MDIMEMGAQILNEKLGMSVDPAAMSSALSGLLGDGEGGVDLAGLAGKMSESGNLGSVISSWLGDGENAPISVDSIKDLLGEGSIADFARTLGTDPESAAAGLTEVVPQIVDKSSSGGSLLDSVGGIGGLMDAAKSFLS